MHCTGTKIIGRGFSALRSALSGATKPRFTLSKVCSVACLSIATWAEGAAAEGNETCLRAYDQAQRLRHAGHYLASHEQLVACAQPACPAVISRDCTEWLIEVEAATPSVVFAARDNSGHELVDVRVYVDDVALTDKLMGRAIAIDPGLHRFRYEAAGAPPQETSVVIREAEKNRLLSVTISGPASSEAQSGGSRAGEAPAIPADNPKPARRAIPATALLTAGAGVLALGSFAFFGLRGHNDIQSMRETCAPNCAESDVSSARTDLLVANVSLGVAVAAFGASIWLYASSRPAKGTAWLSVEPTMGGGLGRFGGSF